MARRAADFGVVVDGPVRADMARVKARKDTISGQSRSGLEESLKTLENSRSTGVTPGSPRRTRPMTRVGRAAEKGETQGFMKMLVDADNQEILGAAVLGTGGDEVVHGMLDVMYAKAPYTVLQRSMPIHPTVSELLPTLLGDRQPP